MTHELETIDEHFRNEAPTFKKQNEHTDYVRLIFFFGLTTHLATFQYQPGDADLIIHL